MSLGLWLHRYCFAITVTKLTSASVLPEARAVTAHAWVESQGRIVRLRDLWRYTDSHRWRKKTVKIAGIYYLDDRTVDSADLAR